MTNNFENFDEEFYRLIYPDVDAAILLGKQASALVHFMNHGFYEGRVSNLSFDEAFYLEANPDVLAEVQQGLLSSGFDHYKIFGYREGRVARFEVLEGVSTLWGTNNSDILSGNHANNILFGQAGNDTLIADEGNDLLVGHSGNDFLQGGSGNDTYSYENVNYGFDIIEDIAGDFDTVLFRGFNSNDVNLRRQSSDLFLSLDVNPDGNNGILVKDWFTTNSSIESLLFDDAHLLLNGTIAVQIDNEIRELSAFSYGGSAQDKISVPLVSIDHTEVLLEGNGWKRLDTNYSVRNNTVLHFDFKVDVEGEIHAIIFDDDNLLNNRESTRSFQLAGTHQFGNSQLDDYLISETDGWKSYAIPVGESLTSGIYDLTLVNDHDVENPTATSRFRNLKLFDTGGNLAVQLNNHLNYYSVESYGGANQDHILDSPVSTDHREVTLQGNGWKRLDTNYDVTNNTVLHFDFKVDVEGEIHAIIFDDDNLLNNGESTRSFQLAGTHQFGNNQLDDYLIGETDGWKSYAIPIGESLTSGIYDLVLVNDHDVENPTATSRFRNLKLATPSASPVNTEPTFLITSSTQDVLTGNSGINIVQINNLHDSLLGNYDKVLNFEIGKDLIDSIHALGSSDIYQLGAVQSLGEADIQEILTIGTFRADGGATFTLGNRTFLALNDSDAGFSAQHDSIIEISGFNGSLAELTII